MKLLTLLPSPYAELAIVGSIATAGLGGFYAGTQHEHRTHVAREAAAAARIDAAREKLVDALHSRDAAIVAADTRPATVREIAREVPIIVRRPGYAVPCLDADGLRLLARSTAAANGERAPAGGLDAAAAQVPAAGRD